jgi:hypothetical protein
MSCSDIATNLFTAPVDPLDAHIHPHTVAQMKLIPRSRLQDHRCMKVNRHTFLRPRSLVQLRHIARTQ